MNANILSCKEYSLLVLRIPTSLDLRPDKPNFLLRPEGNICKNVSVIRKISQLQSEYLEIIELYLNMYTDG